MGVALVQFASNGVTAGGSVTVTFSSATAGNTLIAAGVSNGSGTWTNPSGWTEITRSTDSTGNLSAIWYYKTAAGGETSVVIDPSGTRNISGIVMELSGISGTPTVVSNDDETNLSTVVKSQAAAAAAVTPNASTDFAIAFFGSDRSDTVDLNRAYTASYSETIGGWASVAGAQPGIAIATLQLASGSATNTTFSCDAAESGDEMYGALATFTVAAASIDITATPDTLVITEHQAAVAQAINVNTTGDALSVTEHAAVVSQEINVNAAADALVATEHAATVSLSMEIAATADALGITEHAAAVDLSAGISIAATADSLGIVENPATVSLSMGVEATAASIAVTEHAATVSLAPAVSPAQGLLAGDDDESERRLQAERYRKLKPKPSAPVIVREQPPAPAVEEAPEVAGPLSLGGIAATALLREGTQQRVAVDIETGVPDNVVAQEPDRAALSRRRRALAILLASLT